MADLATLEELRRRLNDLDAASEEYASQAVEAILACAVAAGASDVHIDPTIDAFRLRLRIDGALQEVTSVAAGGTTDLIARLKVLAGLLTYRVGTPQEGRINHSQLEMRLSIFPTLHGERAAIRLFQSRDDLENLETLGFDDDVVEQLAQVLSRENGLLLIAGRPALARRRPPTPVVGDAWPMQRAVAT